MLPDDLIAVALGHVEGFDQDLVGDVKIISICRSERP
ncbi:MAG: hypothetical protein QOJ15_6481 [Bradyrhizobium sp.]|jgi:hypothetical protein|nr:hypothetical protein [Bradyrhizobium sp.]